MLKARKRVYSVTPVRLRWRQRTGVVGGLVEPRQGVWDVGPGAWGPGSDTTNVLTNSCPRSPSPVPNSLPSPSNTDGACRGNPVPGGWGALLLSEKTARN